MVPPAAEDASRWQTTYYDGELHHWPRRNWGWRFGNMQALVEDLKNKCEVKTNRHRDGDWICLYQQRCGWSFHKLGTAGVPPGWADLWGYFNRQLYTEKVRELPAQISHTSMVLSMDNNHSLDLNSVITEVKAQYEQINRCGLGSIGLTGVAERHRFLTSVDSRLRSSPSEARGLPWRLLSLTLNNVGNWPLRMFRSRSLSWRLLWEPPSKYQGFMNIKLALDEITTYR